MSQPSEGQAIVDARAQIYGDPVPQYVRIAQVWSAILDHEVQPWQAALMMSGLKLVRAADTPRYSDNVDDVEGYIDIFRKIMGSDLIHARTAGEFAEKLAAAGDLA